MKKLFLTLLVAASANAVCYSQTVIFSGATTAGLNETKSYHVDLFDEYPEYNQILPTGGDWVPTGGSIVSAGDDDADIEWTSYGLNYVEYFYETWDDYYYGIYYVWVDIPTPSTTFSYTYNCNETVVTRNSGPSTGLVWYWQTASDGTSTALGSSSSVSRTSTDNLYLRARMTDSPYYWSVSSQSIGSITLVTSVPSPGAISGNATICAGSTPSTITSSTAASGQGSISYKWESSPNGSSSWSEIGGATSQSYSPGTISSDTYFRRKATNQCGSDYTSNVFIDTNSAPTTANAGSDQTNSATCGLTIVTLAGNTPSSGSGSWSIISGSGGSLGNSSSPSSSFSGTAGSSYTLRWTISNSPCTSSTDDMVVTFNRNPTAANAGSDQTNSATCGLTSVTLAANSPSIGTGAWSIVSGSGGSFGNSSSTSSSFSGVAGSTYTIRWTISNSPCTSSTDDAVVTFNRNPTSSNAGPDQTGVATCGQTSVTLAGNSPTVGTGSWSVVSGSGGSFGNSSSASSSFSGTAGSTYTLRWTISNSPCSTSTNDVDVKFNNTIAFCMNMNYIIANDILAEGVTNENSIESLNINQKSRTVQYFDGLGRPIQSIAIQGSPNQKDIVQPFVYDELGREHRKYLPVVVNHNHGLYKPDIINEYGTYTGIAANFYGNNPNGKIAQDTVPYSETIFEPSPLNRPSKNYGPGQEWSAADKFVEQQYLVNVHNTGSSPTGEKVVAWRLNDDGYPVRSGSLTGFVESGGYYKTGQLMVSKTIDEHRSQVRQYKNKEGQTVLKKVLINLPDTSNLNSATGWALTYYLYDDFGNLRYVFSPELSKILHSNTDPVDESDLNKWAFQYRFDERQRMIVKKVPGADSVYMVYDNRDRIVLTQDGNQRTKNLWSFIKYDTLNHPVMTGIYEHEEPIGRDAMSDFIDTSTFGEVYDKNEPDGYTTNIFPTTDLTIYTVSFYDSYDFIDDFAGDSYIFKVNHLPGQDVEFIERVGGLVTGTKTNILGTNEYLWSASYYDNRYRAIQGVMENHKDSLDRVTSIYDFKNKVLRTKTSHFTQDTTKHITRTFIYDHAQRLVDLWHRVDDEDSVLIVRNVYNELGQVVVKKLNSRVTNEFSEESEYRYNIRGWLTTINDPDIYKTSLFSFKLNYTNPTEDGGDAQYNGNISEAVWKTAGGDEMSYGYHYDAMNRIERAEYFNRDHSAQNGRFNEIVKDGANSGYDLNGNIKKLQRTGKLTDDSYGNMDVLSYTYSGNRVTQVNDTVTTKSHEIGFKELTETSNEHTYDANGNMITDANKGITLIKYNHLNLPSVVKKSGADSVKYFYDATGRKLKQQVFGGTAKVTDYLGEFIYENDTLRFINHEEGRALLDTTDAAEHLVEYQYHLKDHLGNVRVTFSEKTSITEYKATLETATQTAEQSTFENYGNRNATSLFNHTSSGTYSQLLNGGNNNQIGLAKSFEVKAGEVFDIEVYAKYEAPGGTATNLNNLVGALATVFSLNPVGGTGLEGQAAYEAFGDLFDVGAYVGNKEDYEDDEAPKAYLNYILFDENFELADFGFDQISIDAEQDGISPVVPHDRLSLHFKVEQKGYVYVYISNEQPVQTNVYFDDFKIVRQTGVEQSDDYYPFGLTFNSFQKENSVKNDYLYNGKEKQDELDLGWLDYGARMYLSDIGRWAVMDPLMEKDYSMTAYKYGYNNPLAFTDPTGMAEVYGGAEVDSKTIFSSTPALVKFEGQYYRGAEGLRQIDDILMSRSVFLFPEFDESGEKLLYDGNGALLKTLNAAKGTGAKILHVKNATDAANQLEKLEGKVYSLFIDGHGNSDRFRLRIGSDTFRAADIASSKVLSRISNTLALCDAEIIIGACHAASFVNGGAEILVELAKKMKATVYGNHSWSLSSPIMFSSFWKFHQSSSSSSFPKASEGQPLTAGQKYAIEYNGFWSKVTPNGKTSIINGVYFGADGKIRYNKFEP